jgi:hypothetical protein
VLQTRNVLQFYCMQCCLDIIMTTVDTLFDFLWHPWYSKRDGKSDLLTSTSEKSLITARVARDSHLHSNTHSHSHSHSHSQKEKERVSRLSRRSLAPSKTKAYFRKESNHELHVCAVLYPMCGYVYVWVHPQPRSRFWIGCCAGCIHDRRYYHLYGHSW